MNSLSPGKPSIFSPDSTVLHSNRKGDSLSVCAHWDQIRMSALLPVKVPLQDNRGDNLPKGSILSAIPPEGGH